MLIGHDDAGSAFRAAIAGGQAHHAWLLAGPPGIGKATFADAAAAWLLARAARPPVADDSFDVDAAHPTARLIAAGSHLDLRRLERTTDTNGKLRAVIRVEEVRALQTLFRSTPALSDWRVVVVDSIDDMNRSAANALLKNLEEPPPSTLFLCVTHAPGRLLPTIRSRCRTLRLQPLSDGEVARVIAVAHPELAVAERDALVAIAAGSPGRALRFADANIASLTSDLEALATTSPSQATSRALALAKALSGKAAAARYDALLDLAPAFIAQAARVRSGHRLARAVTLWEKASALGSSAAALSLDPQSVTFELAGLVASLAEP